MLRLVFLIFLSCFYIQVIAQGVVIPKSADIVVIKGKSYYLHTVQPGQTLYSICKTYGVDVEELKALTDKKDNNLSLYEVIKIPFVEPFVEQDQKYYYYRVAKGETLYSISRQYGIKPKRLLKYNTQYAHNEPLAVGAVIRLPLSEIDRSKLKTTVQPVMVEKRVTEEKTEKKEVKEETITLVKPERGDETRLVVVKDTLPVGAGKMVVQDAKQGVSDYLAGGVMSADPFVKIALLLPFSAKEYPLYLDSLGGVQTVTISARVEQFLDFYEGVLLAVDSLKNQGYKIDLHVYDTERNPEKMVVLAKELDYLRPDLIIGPVYGSVYKAVLDNLENKHIPVVYPLSSRSEGFGRYPNFIQVNASFGAVAEKMMQWLDVQRYQANMVYINLVGTEDADWMEKRAFREQLKLREGIQFFNWRLDQIMLDSLRTMLLPDRENILILPVSKEADVSKVLPLISALADSYQITVLGLPEWQTFTSVDHETFYKLNTKLFSYSYVDYQSPEAVAFADKFRKYFSTEPGSLVFKAFDMGLYFIGLAAKYRDKTLEALEYDDRATSFSRFRFNKIKNGEGKENHGFYIVNFGSDYRLKIENPD